jgi:hypothetical protein
MGKSKSKRKRKKEEKNFFEMLKAVEAAIIITQKYEHLLSNPTQENIK